MKVQLEKDTYIVAVSGGVDSVVLLDLLAKQPGLILIVAHYDHGIRADSSQDREFVETLSQKYNTTFVYDEGRLGSNASENTARQARYRFLRHCRKKYQAKAIVTAHHQDDVIETMCINIIRGTNRRGLTALVSREDVRRPLLTYGKDDVLAYARKHALIWREDSTNANDVYLRNWLRHRVLSKLTTKQRQIFINAYTKTTSTNKELESIVDLFMGEHDNRLAKKHVIQADHAVSREIVAHWLRHNGIREFDQLTLERVVIGAKTLVTGKKIPLKGTSYVVVGARDLTIYKH